MTTRLGLFVPRAAMVMRPIGSVMRPISMRVPLPYRGARRAYSSTPPSESAPPSQDVPPLNVDERLGNVEADVFIFAFILCLTLLGGGFYSLYKYEQFTEWKKEVDSNVSELQEWVQKTDPKFVPREIRLAMDSEFYTAAQKAKEPSVKAQRTSSDATERLAARLGDPAQRDFLRQWWNAKTTWEKKRWRELVRDHMGKYEIEWPQEGNPFGGEDNDDDE
ncbi:MAG: hypothetical protein Q9209_007523 [Squamulea sp. 1 TL-2023]